MRGFSLWLSIAVLAGLGGCYSPDLTSGRFACDSKDPVCPDGQRCVRGLCQGDAPTADGGGGGVPDLTSGVGGTACRQAGGFEVGTRGGKPIYACPGLFPSGQASLQCQSGYSVCDSAAGIDQAQCKNDGFFLSSLTGRFEGKVVCGSSNIYPFLIGCGGLPKGITSTECGGFRAALDCAKDDTINCNSGITTAENKLAKNGVLCCP